jgi:hypothetical protein
MASKSLSDTLWIVTVPNAKESPTTTLQAIADKTQQRGLCRLHSFEVPPLNHGTLDSLIALSDELGKYNSQVEVRKQHVSGPTQCFTSYSLSFSFF